MIHIHLSIRIKNIDKYHKQYFIKSIVFYIGKLMFTYTTQFKIYPNDDVFILGLRIFKILWLE